MKHRIIRTKWTCEILKGQEAYWPEFRKWGIWYGIRKPDNGESYESFDAAFAAIQKHRACLVAPYWAESTSLELLEVFDV